MAGIIGHFRAGKGSRIIMNATTMRNNEWDVTDRADFLDFTMFETGGQEQGLTGIEGLDHNGKGDWDAQVNAMDSPPGIFPQDSFPGVKYYENVSDNTFWNIPFAVLLSTQNGAQVRGKVTFGWSGKAQPGWARPTGSV